MTLRDKKIMPPLWLAYPEIERYSIGWRMGYGEDYLFRFGRWLDALSSEEQAEYRSLFPEPMTWKGWWDDEDRSEVLKHEDFWLDVWQPEGLPKYNRQWLQQEFAAGRTRDLCLFWGHQPAEDGHLTRLCHNKQLINSHFYRGALKLPYKFELSKIVRPYRLLFFLLLLKQYL